MNDDILNDAVASIEETREAKGRNADNHDLGHWKHFPIGDVPEVNGLWAQEVTDFVPTCRELLIIAEHWAGVAIEGTYVECANANFSVSTKDWRRIYFAWRRVHRIRALLGDVIDRVVDDQVKKFHDEDGAQWDPETWEKFLPLIDREAQKRHLAPASSSMANPRTRPLAAVASDQSRNPRPSPRVTSKRSTNQSQTNRHAVWVQKNEESRIPSCEAEIPNSF